MLNPLLLQKYRYIAAAILALFASSAQSHATVIVFDPTNYASHVEQVAQHVLLVTRMEQQIENQLRMLEKWNFTRLDQILDELARLGDIFHDAGPTYENPAPGDALNEQYPTTYGENTRESYPALQMQWEGRHRESLIENRRIQNEVAQTIEPTRRRIADYLEHSNNAVGVTSAIQAGNEVVATIAGQLQALQALEVTAARTESEQLALEQSENAFAEARREWVMRDWSAPATAEAIAPPFGR